MFGDNRSELRQMFGEAWRKSRAFEPMTPLEQTIADVVQLHPEYHDLLDNMEAALEKDFLPDGGQTNPFLHMGMHISLREQFSSNHPPGISQRYKQLVAKTGDHHNAEHLMMECLGEVLWRAQRESGMPDENAYLECIQALCEN